MLLNIGALICHLQLDQFLRGGRRLACIKCHVDCHFILISLGSPMKGQTLPEYQRHCGLDKILLHIYCS